MATGEAITIKAPNFQTAVFTIVGTAPYVQARFSEKARQAMIATQMQGTGQTTKRRAKPARDFDADYRGAMHVSREGWPGIPAPAFRNGMISACRIVGFKMTHAKLAVFVQADGFDMVDGTPLIRIEGQPHPHTMHARNQTGVTDIRVRPMWDEWRAQVRVTFDADIFTLTDVANLLMRVGMQVGIGEGRPDSRESAGLGWGTFRMEGQA